MDLRANEGRPHGGSNRPFGYEADKVTVRWPGGAAGTETWTNLDAGPPHVLKQGEGK